MSAVPEKVLVADDEPFILRSLSFVLERAGFEVCQARNGDEALDLLRDRRPRVCILDVMMPRRSGYDVCAVVKGDPELRDTYVMLLTAKGQEAARARGFEVGADEFMTKPFSPSRIVERIHEVLAARAAAATRPAPAPQAASSVAPASVEIAPATPESEVG
jgi:DNA-binding response OmpR family regulator